MLASDNEEKDVSIVLFIHIRMSLLVRAKKKFSHRQMRKMMQDIQLPTTLLLPSNEAGKKKRAGSRPQSVPESQAMNPAKSSISPRRPEKPRRRKSAVMDLQQKFRALRSSDVIRTKNVVEGMAISSLSTRKHAILKLRPVSIVLPVKPISYKFPNRKKIINPRANMKI